MQLNTSQRWFLKSKGIRIGSIPIVTGKYIAFVTKASQNEWLLYWKLFSRSGHALSNAKCFFWSMETEKSSCSSWLCPSFTILSCWFMWKYFCPSLHSQVADSTQFDCILAWVQPKENTSFTLISLYFTLCLENQSAFTSGIYRWGKEDMSVAS